MQAMLLLMKNEETAMFFLHQVLISSLLKTLLTGCNEKNSLRYSALLVVWSWRASFARNHLFSSKCESTLPLSQAGKFAPSQEVRLIVSQICSLSTQVVRWQVSLNQLFSPSKQRIGIPVSPDFLPHQVKFARRRSNFDFRKCSIELCKQLNI